MEHRLPSVNHGRHRARAAARGHDRCFSQINGSDGMTSSKHSAAGLHGRLDDEDARWDDDNCVWASGDHREDHGHDHHSAIHKDLTLQVAPTATSGDFNMHAVLDSPGPTAGRTLMILASGSTYDHAYWDSPVEGGKYSFVDAANR